jgi:hypothetical protein
MSSESVIRLAMIQLMLNRIRPKHADPAFLYASAA